MQNITNMHRSYQPYTPVNNVFLKQKWDQDVYKIHRRKVQAAKTYIDNQPPKTYMHLHIKLKKLQIEATRLAVIERDNRLLLDKMEHILVVGGKVNQTNTYESKSLNKAKRQRELVRVAHENMAILRRLEAKEPTFNHKKWVFERKVNGQYLRNISKYPSSYNEDGEFISRGHSMYKSQESIGRYPSSERFRLPRVI